MPELPETETIARDLDAAVVGAIVADVAVPRPSVLRAVDADALAARVRGARIDRVTIGPHKEPLKSPASHIEETLTGARIERVAAERVPA